MKKSLKINLKSTPMLRIVTQDCGNIVRATTILLVLLDCAGADRTSTACTGKESGTPVKKLLNVLRLPAKSVIIVTMNAISGKE